MFERSKKQVEEIKKIFEGKTVSVDYTPLEKIRLSVKELKEKKETSFDVFDLMSYKTARDIRLNTASSSLGSVSSKDYFLAQPTLRHNILDYISVARLDSKTHVVNFIDSVGHTVMLPTGEFQVKPINRIDLNTTTLVAQKYSYRFIVSEEVLKWHELEGYLTDFIALSFYETAHNNIQSYLASYGTLTGSPGFANDINPHVVASYISSNLSRTRCRGGKNIVIYSSDVYNRYLNSQSTTGEFICSHECDQSYIVISGDSLPSDRYIGFNTCHLLVMMDPQASARVIQYPNSEGNNSTAIEVSFYMMVYVVPSYIPGLQPVYAGSYSSLRNQLR